MNVVFRIKPDEGESDKSFTRLEDLFVKEAETQNLVQLKGFAAFPGIRISMYNALPLEGVQALVAFMSQFKQAQA